MQLPWTNPFKIISLGADYLVFPYGTNLSIIQDMTDLTSIINELKQERDRISAAIKILEGEGAGAVEEGGPGKGNGRRKGKRARRGPRRLSAAARRRISAIAKERWAKAKKAGRNSL
jgi:hypothetical protein